jgi:hypothetical protein
MPDLKLIIFVGRMARIISYLKIPVQYYYIPEMQSG